jgi:hypothetical protein
MENNPVIFETTNQYIFIYHWEMVITIGNHRKTIGKTIIPAGLLYTAALSLALSLK